MNHQIIKYQTESLGSYVSNILYEVSDLRLRNSHWLRSAFS